MTPHISGASLRRLGYAAVPVALLAIAGTACATLKREEKPLENATWKGSGRGDKLQGTADTAGQGWDEIINRNGFDSNLHVSGVTRNDGGFAIHTSTRADGSHADLDGWSHGDGKWRGRVSGAIENSDGASNAFTGGLEVQGNKSGWQGKIDTAGKPDVKFSGHSDGQTWAVDVALPYMSDAHFTGTGDPSMTQQLGVAMAYYAHQAA